MINLTHLDELYWKEDKITKRDMIEYYAKISEWILPYLKNRPMTLHRYPKGIEGASFYQKNAGIDAPSYVKTVNIEHSDKTVNYVIINNLKSLLYVANLGSIELHPFHSRIKHLDEPDYMLLDLDPRSISFEAVIEVAQAIHEFLEEINVPSYCKTSGSKGLHILVPLGAKYSYDQSRQFAGLIAMLVHQKLPSITSLERRTHKRENKVYIDTLQNYKGQTMAAPYSLRPKPHAPVSTPLYWEEVKKGLDPLDFTIKTVPKRISQEGDLFKGLLGKGINLGTALKKLEKLF